MSNINCKTRRAGGGFGGKLTRQCLLACACSVAAQWKQQPVRAQLDRMDDMQMIVGRENMNFKYNVTFDKTGKVDTYVMDIDFNPGWFYGDSAGDLDMAIAWSDNCFHYNSFKTNSRILTTDTPHSTSQRGPGCLQSLVASTVVMEHIAKNVGKNFEDVQYLNFYKPGDMTPFGDMIGRDGYNFTLPRMWEQLMKECNFVARKQAIENYNVANKWTKKGIAITPVKYVMATMFYSSGALVCVYGDGNVLVTTGGVEIGQGLDTKVALCAANALGVPLDKISVGPTETSKVPNNTGTGGSGTSESSAQAVIMACQEIIERLAPYRGEGVTWEQAVGDAIAAGVSMMATSWHKQTGTHNSNLYATYGVSISEVMVDVLTGETRVEQVDVLMDLGNQLDAAVDIGQLQGGFMMALGYALTEQLHVDAQGTQLAIGTWDYKIPSAHDVPLQFNVSLLKDTPNPVGVKGSKASAEPAMALVASTYHAVKQAVYAARKDGSDDAWFMLNLPLTPENVRQCCNVTAPRLTVPPCSTSDRHS